MKRMGWCLIPALALVSACADDSAGSFSVVFTWEGEGPSSPENLWLSMRVEERSELTRPGRLLTSAGPAAWAQAQTLSLRDVPNGVDRVVVAELARGSEASAPIAYYGISAKFDLRPGTHVEIEVPFRVRAVPAAPAGGGVSIADLEPGARVSTTDVTLLLETDIARDDTGAVPGRAKISNLLTFPADATQTVTLAELDDLGTEGGFSRLSAAWDLDFGLSPCGETDFCPRRVYVRFVDPQGYESETLSTDVTVDALPPTLVRPAGADTTLSPAVANRDSLITVSLTFSEVVRSGLLPELEGGDDLDFLRLFPPDESDSATFTFQAQSPASVLGAEGETELRITAEDLASNRAEISLGRIALDLTAPSIELRALPAPVDAAQQEAGGRLEVGIALSEAPAPSYPRVRIGVLSAPCEPDPAGEHAFLCAYTLTGAEGERDGEKAITVVAADLAGNIAEEVVGNVAFDVLAPLLSLGELTPSVVPTGTDVVATLSFNEAVRATPVLSGEPALPGSQFECGPVDTELGPEDATSTWVCHWRSPAAGSVDSDHRIFVDAVDVAGNASRREVGQLRLDSTRPMLTLVSRTPAANIEDRESGGAVEVVFDVTEEAAPGFPRGTFGAHSATCEAQGETDALHRYRCSYALQGGGAENDGPQLISVTVADAGGNVVTETFGSVGFDFTRPTVVSGSASLQLIPSEDSPLTSVDRATNGTRLRATFTLSEALADDSPDPTVSADDGAIVLTKTSQAGSLFVYEGMVSGAAIFRDESVSLVIADLPAIRDSAGNAPEGELELASFTLDTRPPTRLDPSGANTMVFTRTPWGSEATGGVQQGRLAGLATAAGNVVIAYHHPDAAASAEVGRALAGPDRAFTLDIFGPSRSRLYVREVDPAGNLGDAAPVRDVVWVATPGHKVADSELENPNVLLGSHHFAGRYAQDGDVEPPDSAALGSPAPTPLQTGARPDFTQRFADVAAAPNPFHSGAAAWDAERDELVVFGGLWTTETPGGVSIWNGHVWRQVTPSDPEGDGNPVQREGPKMVWDAVRRRVVMYGGTVNSATNEIWEWDGASWAQRHPQRVEGSFIPTLTEPPQVTWDATHGVMLMHRGAQGSFEGVWEWNGTRWLEREIARGNDNDLGPLERHAIAWDAAREVVVLFGGANGSRNYFDDTWIFEDGNWHLAQPTDPEGDGNPQARTDHLMVWDDVSERVLMFGGLVLTETFVERVDDLWAWDGQSWEQLLPADPEGDGNPMPRAEAAGAWDSIRRQWVIVGGSGNASAQFDDAWRWTGSSWANLVPNPVDPDLAPRIGLADVALWNDLSGQVDLFGGSSCRVDEMEMWRWNGELWRDIDPGGSAEPRCLESFAAAWDRARDRIVVHGGLEPWTVANFSDNTWEWDGESWERQVPTDPEGDGNPPALARHDMVWDARRQRMVMFGGQDSDLDLQGDLWEWDGRSWERRVPADPEGDGNPVPRTRITLAWDPVSERVLLHGGLFFGNGEHPWDMWAWDGVSWALIEVDDPEGDGEPGRHTGHRIVWNAEREKLVMVGGFGDLDYTSELWEWTGQSWARVHLVDAAGDGQPEPRSAAAVTWDEARRRLFLYGGYRGQSRGAVHDTWELVYPEQVAQIFRARFDAARAPEGTEVSELGVRWFSGARADGDGAEQLGATLLAWDGGGWVEVASNGAGVEAPGVLQWSTTDPERISALRFGPRDEIGFAVVSPPGGVPEVSSTYIEVEVHYRLPE